jgi:hypothetical protein
VNKATDIQHLIDLPIFEDEDYKRALVSMDERHIAVFIKMHECTMIYFVSTEKLIIEQTLRVGHTECYVGVYQQGFLITEKNKCIR